MGGGGAGHGGGDLIVFVGPCFRACCKVDDNNINVDFCFYSHVRTVLRSYTVFLQVVFTSLCTL